MAKLNVEKYIGLRLGKIRVISEVPSYTKANSTSVCGECECGTIKNYVLNKLTSGHTKSCGCDKGERGQNLKTHGLRKHPLYGVWNNMKSRCYSSKSAVYRFYGGRGVKVCDEWVNSFESFYNWAIQNGWEKGLELDKDKRGDGMCYSPDTCCFLTKKKNKNITRRCRYIMVENTKYSLSELSEKFNIDYRKLQRSLNKGISIENIIMSLAPNKNVFPEIKYAFGFIG